MKRIEKRFSFALLFTLIVSFCGIEIAAKPNSVIKRKEITRSFNINSNDRLEVNNKYGNITISHWDKNEVLIKVEIESRANNDMEAQEEIERVYIESNNEGGTIYTCTHFKERKKGSNNQLLTVNYFIQIPDRLKTRLTQKYGNINLPECNNNEMEIILKYGNLKAGDFTYPLSIDAKYSNIKLGNIKEGQLELGYVGNADILNAKKLNIGSKYSNISIKNLENMDIMCKYGNISIENIKELNMDLAYSDIKIGSLKDILNVEKLSYSNISIKLLSPSFKSFNVESHYGNVKLYLPSNASFKVIANNMKYSNCNIDGFKMTMNRFNKLDKNYTFEINGGKQPIIYFNGNNYGNINIKAK